MRHLGSEKRVAVLLGYFGGGGGEKNYSFFHHGLSPDGLTLSAGGLAATSLKTDHSAFLCVCY